MDNFKFKIDGISEDELQILLTLSKEELEYIKKIKLGLGIIPIPNLYLSNNITKDDIFNGKEFFNLLDNKFVLGILYILDCKQYTYYRELKSINGMHWKPIIDRLIHLNIINKIKVSENMHDYLIYKNKLGSYHINKMIYYSLSEEFIKIMPNIKDYVDASVEKRFKDFVSNYFIEYEEIQKEIKLSEMPTNIKLYEINKHKWNSKQKKEYKQMLLSNKNYVEWMKQNDYNL